MGDTGKGFFELFDSEEDQHKSMEDFLENIPKVTGNDLLQNQIKKFKEEYENHGGIFSVGEELEIKGSRFVVESIDKEHIHLKLLKKD